MSQLYQVPESGGPPTTLEFPGFVPPVPPLPPNFENGFPDQSRISQSSWFLRFSSLCKLTKERGKRGTRGTSLIPRGLQLGHRFLMDHLLLDHDLEASCFKPVWAGWGGQVSEHGLNSHRNEHGGHYE